MSNTLKLENEGNILTMTLPDGFSMGDAEREDNYLEFLCEGSASAKVCYWSRPFFVSPSNMQRIEEIFGKEPHKLSENEVMDLLPCMAPGRWAYNGNFTQLSFSTLKISGRGAMCAELKFNDQDKHSYVIFANPDSTRGYIDIIWFEAPSKIFTAQKQRVVDALQTIQWKEPEPAAFQ